MGGQIPQTKHTAEEYLDIKKEEKHLLNERQDILEYQEKLDSARERSNSDDFSKEELDVLGKEFEVDMPIAVKRQMLDYDPSQETSLKSVFSTNTINSVTPPLADISTIPSKVPKIN